MKKPSKTMKRQARSKPAACQLASAELRDSARLKKPKPDLETFLEAPSYKHVEQMYHKLGQAKQDTAKENMALMGVLLVCSLCSGTNCFPLTAYMCMAVMRVGQVQDLFHAEKKDNKKKFGSFLSSCVSKDPTATCVFPDMTLLHDLETPCDVHGTKTCPIKGKFTVLQPLLGTAGFCCTNISKMAASCRGKARSDYINEVFSKHDGSTGQTARGLLKYVGVHRLPVLMFENSDRMLAATLRDEWEWFVNTAAEMGYHVRHPTFTDLSEVPGLEHCLIIFFPQTSVALGVLAVLVED